MAADLELLRRYADTRDAGVFADLTSTYADMVFGTCLRILSDRAEAEDAAQECFWRLARESASIRISVGAWLHRCATNEAITRKRRRASRLQRERAHETERQARQEESSEWMAVSGAVDQAMDALPSDLRDLLVAHFLQRKTQADLAREMNISPATMSRRIAEGVGLLRQQMKRMGVVASVVVITGLLMRTGTAAPLSGSLVAGLGKIALAGPAPRIPWWAHAGVRAAIGGTAATAAAIAVWVVLQQRAPAAPKGVGPAAVAVADAGYAAQRRGADVGGSTEPGGSLRQLGALGFPTGPQVLLSDAREVVLTPSMCWDEQPFASLGSGGLLSHNQMGANDLGADVEAVPGVRPQLRGVGMATWPVDNARFETLQVEAHLNRRLDLGVGEAQALDATVEGTQTYLFISREKRRGILQCSAVGGGIAVRWRLFSGPGIPEVAAASAVVPAEGARRFTEVRDGVLANGGADEVSAMDLDNGSARRDPTRSLQPTAMSVMWLRSWGGDVATVAGEHLGLTLNDGVWLPVSNGGWERLTATEVAWLVGRHTAGDGSAAVIDPAPPPESGVAHTWVFVTREGGEGLLQIQGGGLTPTQPVRIRYKLAVKN